MIILRNIYKKYNDNYVLKNINIKFPEKGLIMLLGKSGSGKSTLLNIIGGIDTPTSGSIFYKGIEINKASTILASIELGSGLNNNIKTINNTTFNNANTIYNYYKNILKNEKQEYFYVIYLNKKLKIIDNKMLFKGTVDYSLVHPREIFKEAYLLSANYIICIHNHPTGNTLPSNDDFNITKNIKSVGEILGVYLIDHIIIGTNNYYSFKENNDI